METNLGLNSSDLELGVIGNCSIAVLENAQARVVWGCFPDFDGDPCFCDLLSPKSGGGFWAFELDDFERSEQHYLPNTAVLVTRLYDKHGGAVEITDFAPRFKQYDRIFHPMMLVRQLTCIAGVPRLRMQLEPLSNYGEVRPERIRGSNHIRYVMNGMTLRLSSDLPLPHVERGLPFVLQGPLHFILGPDEAVATSISGFVRDALERTREYWREWARYLSLPLEWQDVVIRAAITLKLCQSEATGGIVAAVTTSIPECPDSQRNWDYRFCWLRDAAFVVRALNRLGATRSMEEYLRYLSTLAMSDAEIGPVFGITFERELHERFAEGLGGYRGMGPVRVGNDAWRQRQNDVYGSVILATAQLFFDERIELRNPLENFLHLEPLGLTAVRIVNTPDAGLWEFRGRLEIHTYSAVMCWAACDRLAKIAKQIGLAEREDFWRQHAQQLHTMICERSFLAERGYFSATFDRDQLDASLLLLADVGFLKADDPRFIATVEAVGAELKRGNYLFRYSNADDFGKPVTSFTLCTFWYIDALAMIGRRDEARAMFENMLQRRTALGLLSEDIEPKTGELWGNFPQTYSMVGLINAAMRLSRPWEAAF
jgi:GH15 family glucan-1,4-alpha-glucosidase